MKLLKLNKINIIFLILAISLITNSCTKIYGLKKTKTRTIENIQKFAKKYDIPKNKNFIIDTSYFSYIYNLDTNLNQIKNNHLQPLQVLYFNKSGKLISYHINCYTGGFPNLKWNSYNAFDVFPAKTRAPIDSLFNFSELSKFINKTNANQTISNKNDNYKIVVFWSIFMGRQSKRLIKLVKENTQLSNKPVNLIFVNTDNLYLF